MPGNVLLEKTPSEFPAICDLGESKSCLLDSSIYNYHWPYIKANQRFYSGSTAAFTAFQLEGTAGVRVTRQKGVEQGDRKRNHWEVKVNQSSVAFQPRRPPVRAKYAFSIMTMRDFYIRSPLPLATITRHQGYVKCKLRFLKIDNLVR